MRKFYLLLTSLSLTFSAFGEVKLPNIIGSNMVIQQNSKARVWGVANKNAKVEITLS